MTKRGLVLVVVMALTLAALPIGVGGVAAKNAGSFWSGSRATRGDDSAPSTPSDPGSGDYAVPDAPKAGKAPQPDNWRRTVRKALFGGLIGSLFFGKRFGGLGLLEIVALSGLILLAFRALSKYQAGPVRQYAGASAFGGGLGTAIAGGPPIVGGRTEAGRTALDDALDAIRAGDPGFDTASFARTVEAIFRKVQAAWSDRNIRQAADVLSVEMLDKLDRECRRLRSAGRVNRVESIALQRAAIVGAWHDGGWDRVTVQISAALVDYTTDESGLKVVAGNPFAPILFREQWELVRPSGPHAWRVSAIA